MAQLGIRTALAQLLALVSTAASAQLVDCTLPSDDAYGVFLSEPRYTSAAFESREDMLRVFDRLQLHLDQREDIEMAGLTSDVEFRVARCEGRVPELDGGDFSDDIVASLYTRGVVVEIWGKLDAKPANGASEPIAQMNYLIVPVRMGADKGLGIQRFTYPDGDIVATDFVELIANADLHAFMATGIAVTAFDDEDYALAHQMACRAHAHLSSTLRRLESRPAAVNRSEDVVALRTLLIGLARDAIDESHSAPGVVPPFALLQDPANPCAGT